MDVFTYNDLAVGVFQHLITHVIKRESSVGAFLTMQISWNRIRRWGVNATLSESYNSILVITSNGVYDSTTI
jgi:hypothetical protein